MHVTGIERGEDVHETDHCRRSSALGLLLVLGASQALAADLRRRRGRRTTTRTSSCSRSTTSTGTWRPTRRARSRPAAAVVATQRRNAWLQTTVPAGGIEYLATHIKQLREQNSNTITVGAGDLIGASPLVSALFHDEPAIEAVNAFGMDVSGVGNHEFDEGVPELLRMQNGGCHPVDGCQDGDGFAGAVFQYLAANVFYEGTDTDDPARVQGREDRQREDRVHRPDARRAHRRSSLPSAVAGLEFRPEVATVNALVDKLRNEQGVKAFVVLLHQGGFQNPPSVPVYPAPANPDAYTDVNKCVNFSGPEVTSIAQGLDPAGRRS